MNNAWYALRRTLVPWRFDELANELLEKLPAIGVDELIAKVDPEEFTHGQPNLEFVNKFCRKLAGLKIKLEEQGITFSLNPWITFGHNDRGRSGNKNIPGLQTMVGHDGVECECCACALSSAWQEHVKKVWAYYARLKPHAIWVEDDIRTFNHQPVSISCFCPLHMKRFAEIIGKKVSREELTAAIMKPGKPHAWRKIYLDMQRDIILEVVNMLAETVRGISPDTIFGLMSSGPRMHCLEGRDWNKLAKELTNKGKLISRPPLGNYSENSLRGLYYSADSIKLTRHVLPEGTIEQTEVENVPFTKYSKSTSLTFLQMAISFALGCSGVTMNLFDHAGSLMAEDGDIMAMLGREKKYFNALASAAQGCGTQRGVQLLFSEQHAYEKVLGANGGYCLDSEDYCLAETLESMGISTTFSDEKVRASIGQALRCFSNDDIMRFLGGGLFVDSIAAEVLVERGFGKYIGIDKIESPVNIDAIEPLSAEEYHNKKFGGDKYKMLTLTIPELGGRPSYSHAGISKNAKIISHLVDPDAKRKFISMYAIENSLGGRIVVHLLDWTTACGTAFNHTYRRQQLQNVMCWLGRGNLPSIAPNDAYPLLLRRDFKTHTILSAFNLTLDEYPKFTAKIADIPKIKAVHTLSDKGLWQNNKALQIKSVSGKHSFTYNKPLAFNRPLVIRIDFAT